MAKFRSKSKSKPSNKTSKSSTKNRKVQIASRTGRISASPNTQNRTARRQVASVAGITTRPDTKQAQVIAMLRRPEGATIDAMVRSTGWQQHSVRGFLAAVVRKRLGLDLTSETKDSGRVYRIVELPLQKTVDAP